MKQLFVVGCWLFGPLCIGNANAEEYCVPSSHTLTYRVCSGCTGTAPAPVTVGYNAEFTTLDASAVCGNNTVNKWRIYGTNDYITSNTTLPYVWVKDITLVAGGECPMTRAELLTHVNDTEKCRCSYASFCSCDKYGTEIKQSLQSHGEWLTMYSWGTVRGIAVCDDDTTGRYCAVSNTEHVETGGGKCWCKMTWPAVSKWVNNNGNNNDCPNCAAYCAYRMGASGDGYYKLRRSVFGSVAE